MINLKKITGQHQQYVLFVVISGMEWSGIPEMSSHHFGNSVILHSRNEGTELDNVKSHRRDAEKIFLIFSFHALHPLRLFGEYSPYITYKSR